MIEALRSLFTDPSFPSLHVMVVHFPIAFIAFAPLLDIACLVFRDRVWLDRAAAAMYLVGTLGAGAAYLLGEEAAEAVQSMTPATESVLADHEAQAVITLVVLAAATLIRLIVTWLGRDDRRIKIGIFRLLALPAVLAALAMLALTADLGGRLVYHYGVGVNVESSNVER
ncbi:MAG: hypothetical protein MUP13_11540 [Thermoanaerobaculales bacterium]|nr:hypothetical protein [Thermoanaerobaculales bacterium]